uniref:CYTOSOL_AP domain-containing protein n=1 Tax=Rhodnius prolixus TaxID=13249 RepID=T1HA32_RHOPR
MTPTNFAISAVEALSKTGVSIHVKVREWAKENGMNGFLAASRGSGEDPIFLELLYNGCDPCEKPIVLIGKGVTFDAGGLCLKNKDSMAYMRGDMAGAACVVATMRAITSMKLPMNVRGLIPLCENMPGATAAKPGDIIKAMNGITVLIDNTDHEGMLVLADALSYSTKYDPKFILDVGTLTKDMQHILAQSATGVFTNCSHLWTSMKNASIHTGDRVWRLPLWRIYDQQIKPEHVSCDLTNAPVGRNGFSCAVAAFLRHFIYHYKWIHMDTYGVMLEHSDTPYLRAGMSGRPTRTLVEFLAQISCRPTHDIKGGVCYPPEMARATEEEVKKN